MDPNLTTQPDYQKTEPLQVFKDEAEKIKSTVKEQAGETAIKIKDEAKAASGHLKEAGKRFADSQKTALSAKTEELAGAVTALSDKLQDTQEPNLLAGPARTCAEQLTTLSRYLKDSDPEQILHGVERLARRRPELVYGGLFLTGLLAARFLKASGARAAEKAREDHRQQLPRYDSRLPESRLLEGGVLDSGASQPGATYFNPSNL